MNLLGIARIHGFRRLRTAGATIGIALLLLAGAMPPAKAAEILVFAAASLKNALDEATGVYQKRSGDTVKISYAASSALARQIESGAPAQMFISADLDWMDYLQQRNLIQTTTRKNWLGNKLVLAGPAWVALLFVVPIMLSALVIRCRTVADSETVTARSLVSSETVGWDDIDGLRFGRSSWASAHLKDGRELRLPAVTFATLPLLTEVSGGRVPNPYG